MSECGCSPREIQVCKWYLARWSLCESAARRNRDGFIVVRHTSLQKEEQPVSHSLLSIESLMNGVGTQSRCVETFDPCRPPINVQSQALSRPYGRGGGMLVARRVSDSVHEYQSGDASRHWPCTVACESVTLSLCSRQEAYLVGLACGREPLRKNEERNSVQWFK